MAGLQYKFFPTDFLFPLQQSASGATTTTIDGANNPARQVSLVKTDKSEESKQQKSMTGKSKIVKAVPSSSVAHEPIIRKQD
ncbi:hypothetical protein PHJA_000231400 [Phtheirospermum japonicum]|uniref:Uncharacterized protein n=1 Tax=Phtheirospermum japonicum TaxID=374723 RepID=A0A830BFS1_9LAMI|nr:hypothetical protein PHJA_000231400 [Phtheirospermum japonicum]